MKLRYTHLILFLFMISSEAKGQGKHLEIMAPHSRQRHLLGLPQTVVERHFESSDKQEARPTFTVVHEYDLMGNELRYKKYDLFDIIIKSNSSNFNESGTWISLKKNNGKDKPAINQIVLEPKSKQIAKLDNRSKPIEQITYSEEGYETFKLIRTSNGETVERTTTKRVLGNQAERIIVEDSTGKKISETQIEWEDNGRQLKTIHNQDGDQLVTLFEYPKIDEEGNWLTRISTQVIHKKDGEISKLPTKTIEREITYHGN